MQTNQSLNRTVDRLLPPKHPTHNQRLERPGDMKFMQFLSAYPDNKAQLVNGMIMIPIPPEDAKALGLRVPDSDNFSMKPNSTSSRSSAELSSSRSRRKRSNDDTKSKRDQKRHHNTEVKLTKKLLDLKQEQKAQRAPTLERLTNFQAKLERGLKNISHKTKVRPKANSYGEKDSDVLQSNAPRRRLLAAGKQKKSSSSSHDEKPGKLKKESSSKSTRQLFSTAESWSNDSVVSHSDNCACCHSREPCPFHGNEFFGIK
ncbi:uncharacterized protein LOC113463992 [Ceratina calcarata]|uniref:Uncharacterized protein LOC113463992 n=1 Tax=Ceratina calcarata TaxID=156304 RepID=A0AAJ7W8S6_9HYME|nr:uncharacterized protein LOC113463992 [Ceratina calcarata]